MLPPELVALERHTSELKLTSMRFVLRQSTIFPATAPAAANVSLIWFGHKLTLRTVGGHDYAYNAEFGRGDHGRPWIRLGRGGLDELLTVNGHPLPSKQNAMPNSGVPTGAEPPFAALEKDLAGAREVHPVGAGSWMASR